MTNFPEHNDTGDPGRTDDALDGIVDESAIHDEAIIAELLEADGQLVDRCVHAVRRIVAASCEPMLDEGCDPWDLHDEISSAHRAVALQLLGRPEPTIDEAEADSLDGEQGIACRLRPVPSGFADYAHNYVAEACSGTRRAAEFVAEHEHHRVDEAELRHASLTERSLHDFLDALLDSWQVSEITHTANLAQVISGYHFHSGWKHIRGAAS
jgi:hypothetical protein